MENAILTWYSKLSTETDYESNNEKYLGTATSASSLTVNLRLWNNRYGTEDTSNLTNFALRLSFSTVEDSKLLQYCSVTYNNATCSQKTVGNHAIVTFPSGTNISGSANNGVTSENPNNYLDFQLKFAVDDNSILKENDLKNLYIEIIEI